MLTYLDGTTWLSAHVENADFAVVIERVRSPLRGDLITDQP